MRARRSPVTRSHLLVTLVTLCAIAAGLSLTSYVSARADRAEQRLFGHWPTYYSGPLNAEPLADYGRVFSVAHNAGTSLNTTRQAIASEADVVEIDVALMNDTLVSAHIPPYPVFGSWFFRGPSLESAWNASAEADVVQLDLKESGAALRKLLFRFLELHANDRTVLVATSDVTTLGLLRERFPQVLRFLSVPDSGRLASLHADADLVDLIDGVTIRYQLVTAESVERLKALGLIVLAWTVNDLATVNEFVQWGVDGVSTNNLAIMELLGGRQSGALLLGQRR